MYWQFVGAIKGMSAACEKFATPVTGGNVSFYNQTQMGDRIEPIFPTPTIAMIGLVEDTKLVTTIPFKAKGDLIYMLGMSRDDISSSQYLVHCHGVEASPAPFFSLEEEFTTLEQLKVLIRKGVVASAHDVSEGGLFIALLESAMQANMGFDITSDVEIRPDAFLFGESQSRIVVSVNPDNDEAFIDHMMLNDIEFALLGHVTKGSIRIDYQDWGKVSDFEKGYLNSLAEILEG